MTFGAVQNPTLHPQSGFTANAFVGRRGEMREIKNLLADSRLITLTGPGGVGKSRLAHHTTAALGRAYEGGIRHIDLVEAHDANLLSQELQSPELLAHLIAATLGLPPATPGAGTAIEVLTSSFALRPVLLLLDNCEHVLPACAVLAEALLRACPQVRIMATSREPFKLGEEVLFPVRPLPTPDPVNQAGVAELALCDSVALFAARAQAVSTFALTEQNTPAVAELCRRLDGLPLAIELAATRTRALAPAQIVQRTDERFGLLSRGSRTAPQRQRTLRACVDWSFELCSKPERLLWGRLSVFHGAFELNAVEAVCADESLPAEDLLEPLAGLVDKSVLISERSGGRLRYRMLDTLRDYGRGKLIEAGRQDELSRRHRDWYAQLLRRSADNWFGPGQVEWSARLDRELLNLRAALAYSVADPDAADATLVMAANLWHRWAARGRYSEGRCWLDQALSRATGPTGGLLEALYGNSVLAAAQGDLVTVRASVRQAHEVAAQRADAHAYAIAACADGVLATAVGDLSEAVRAWRRAVEGFTTEQTGGWRATALAGLATAVAMSGDAGATASCHEEIVAMCAPHEEFQFSGVSLASLGLGLFKGGDLKTAAVRLREGLRRLRRVDDLPGIAWCLEVMAWIVCEQRRAERAATLLGAVAGIGQAAGMDAPVPRPLSAHHQEWERRIRATLGELSYREAFARGQAMSVDDAVAYGSDERRQPPPPPPGEAPTPLTRREQQVAELVARGESNKGIAAALVISRRTAESHIEKIMVKLGFNNRAQVAAWMVAQWSKTGQDVSARSY